MLNFDEGGLLPTIAQDARTGQVLMLAFMNREALERTLSTGEAWFYSRSRQELWHKGETSGSFLKVRSVQVDCDADALLLLVEPSGPICHTGAQSCFFQELTQEGIRPLASRASFSPHILDEVFAVIQERQRTLPEGSYVASLLRKGIEGIGAKVTEEAAEAIEAAKGGKAEEIAWEVADLWFHSLVLLAESGLSPEVVWEELRRRRR